MGAAMPEFGHERLAGLGGNIDKADPGALPRKGTHHGFSNAGRPAGDDDGTVFEAGIAGERRHHGDIRV
ncbi:hypothetical protein D9M68_909870 [compost metagenome]